MNFREYLTEQKKYSAGVVITDGEYMLVCKTSYGNDIPKGEIDSGESPIQAAIREVKEETGYTVSKNVLEDFGNHSYIKGEYAKDLHIFKYEVDELPKLNSFHCDSYYIDKKTGKKLPEVLGYDYIKVKQMGKGLSPNMKRVVSKVF